ncbi:hypothetical protein BSLG_009813 [Batrachochytrium salamandrivorans]|nr:hypothetical protein BSLG_009813 [Batrachochytrium salamandrivorans]
MLINHLSYPGIAIPNCANLCVVTWNNDQGWIACGGDNGLLKVLKLESSANGASSQTTQYPASGSGLERGFATNGRLTGAPALPSGAADPPSPKSNVAANSASSQLTMNQTLEGHQGDILKYRFVYMELNYVSYVTGAVILGSVDGNRIWGKELKNTLLSYVQWSPDGKFLLFGTATGELQLFDNQGVFMCKLGNYCNSHGNSKLAAIDWYNGSKGYMEPCVPCLAVCYENGKIQIMRNDKDTRPILIDTNMKSLKMKWNANGTTLAVSGLQPMKNSQGESKETCVFLQSIKVPGKHISSISWKCDGLSIALAVDSFIYFANIRPDYKWSFFAQDVVVYAYHKPEISESTVVFWNTKTNDKNICNIKKLIMITSSSDHCLIISSADDDSQQYRLTIYNAIGIPTETKSIEFEPKFASISKTHVFVASSNFLFHWQFKSYSASKMSNLEAIRRKNTCEQVFHIDDISAIGSKSTSMDVLDLKSRRLSILDLAGILRLFDLKKKRGAESTTKENTSTETSIILSEGGSKTAASVVDEGRLLDFERKDVWGILWASDNPEQFAIMEKTRMYTFQDLKPEAPINYLCSFSDLQVKTISLDAIMEDSDNLIKDTVVTIETKIIRNLRTILNQTGLADAIQFVENQPHPRLWRIVAEAALELLDFSQAQKAFVCCQDYQGLQFIKSLQKFDDPAKQKAEIAAYCTQFDVAEKMYLEMDRKDLAIQLRIRMGDWFRVVQLIKSGGGCDDQLLEKACNHIGDHYYDQQRWTQAISYYSQARNQECLVECYYIVEDYENIEKLSLSLSENSSLLTNIAEKFVSVGLCDQAAAVYVKLGDIAAAINTCVFLNQWNAAIELAEIHNFKDIGNVLAKYASYLLSQNQKWEAVALYRKANYCQKSARLLFELASEVSASSQSVLLIKKLYVLAALEVERYHSISKANRGTQHETATSALDGLLAEDSENMDDHKFLDNAWRGAEAYHFYILAQRQFYSGDNDGALITALHLREYEDVIDPKTIFSLLALISFHSKKYNTCSKTFIKLEALSSSTTEEREAYENLALNIFTKYT